MTFTRPVAVSVALAAMTALLGACALSPQPSAPAAVVRDGALRYLTAFVEDRKTSGFVAQALARHGIEGAAVAGAAR
jgi:hypothetical protein